MKAIKFFFYFFFSFFVLLFVAGYFLELFFSPSEKKIFSSIGSDPAYPLQFDSVDWNGTSIGFVKVGNDTSQRVIMVHGSPGNWKNFYEALKYADFYKDHQLIAIDRWGYGITGGAHGEPDLGIHAAYIHELCKPSKGGRKPILVGHSMGGPIVIKSAIDYGNELAGVISVAGSFDASLEPNEWFRGLYRVFPLNLIFNRDLKASNDELFTHRLELEKMSSEWQNVNCKVTIIQGGKDNLVAPGNLEYAKEKLKGKEVTYTFIPNEDHFIPFTNPEPMLKAIEDMGR